MTENFGRGLFTTREIKEGEVVIGEKALAIGRDDYEESKKLLMSFDEDKNVATAS